MIQLLIFEWRVLPDHICHGVKAHNPEFLMKFLLRGESHITWQSLAVTFKAHLAASQAWTLLPYLVYEPLIGQLGGKWRD